jgi:GNAT superfamily N-acetyltransferase
MTPTPTIRSFAAHEWATYKRLRLHALADSPDAFGRTLAEEQDRPDELWSSRLAAGAGSEWDLPLLAEVDGLPAGLAWGRIESSNPELANLYQMWVAPEYRGLGAGRMLLEAVIAWARAKGARHLELGVTLRDSPAMRLYTRAGFELAGEPEPIRPGAELLATPMRLEL